ncbi:nitrogen regulatory protein P-II homolog isoform X1 [Pyrus x bretschneideri]|uniref:nitrogen regulatory protein P-II homolog isoform X1 n=1 Tax=Pyrus x bretschneideri TaxID=225117 RepID=UPI00203071D3|nr:nitrogen regulatory protein P-II homolog isoform X1 [Pyrus x bretschneideri]
MATIGNAGLLSPFHCHLNELPLLGSSSIRTKLAEFRFRQPNVALKHARNASIFPVVRAQSSSGSSFSHFSGKIGYVPDSKFYKVEAILRPWRVSQVSSALLKIGIRGVTVSDVRGFGAQGGSTERQGGSEFSEDNFVAKIKMEIVVSKDQVEAVVDTIIEAARTGEIGDGKIFVVPVSDVIRVRTGERGEKAEKMTGGRSDVSSSSA